MEFIQENLYLVSIAVFSGLMLIYSSLRVPGGGNALTPTEATLLINRENAQVVDVRDAAEYTRSEERRVGEKCIFRGGAGD